MFPLIQPAMIVRRARRAWVTAGFGLLVWPVAAALAQGERSPRWTYKTEGYIQSSPAVDREGTIYFGANQGKIPAFGFLYAIKRNGAEKFPAFRTNEDIDSAPAIGPGGEIYFGCWNGVFYALLPNGTKKWEFTVGGSAPYIASSPAIGQDGIIYFGMGDLLEPGKSALIALTPGGIELWRRTVGNAVDSSPALGPDGSIYFGSWDHYIYGLNRDGTVKWRVLTGAEVLSSPAIGVDGTLYIGSSDRRVYAITPEGGVAWTFLTSDSVIAAPALGADGTVYVGSTDGFFYALEPRDGTLKWRFQAGPAISSTAAVRADGTIIFGADAARLQGTLYALDSNGGLKWRYVTDDHIRSSPVVDQDGFIYVGSHDRKLHAITDNNSPLSSYSNWPMFRRDALHSGWAQPRSRGGRLINLSTLAVAGGTTNLIAGFAIDGSASKHYLIRAVGPTLTQFGVVDPLRDPTVTVRTPSGQMRAFNNDWGNQTDEGPSAQTTAPQVGAFPLLSGSKDAAVVPLLEPGLYTALVGSTDGSSGTALVEAYDAAPTGTGSAMINLSTRGPVGPALLTPGLVVGGTEPLRVLIRAVGPGLQAFGVPGVLARPSLSIFSGQTVIYANTGWTTDGRQGDLAGAGKLSGAFALVEGSADSAALVTLAPGDHTIQVSGAGGTRGEVLVEIYIVR